MTKVNKYDLIKDVSAKTDIPASTVKEVINAFCGAIEANILNDNEVLIKGLVRFYNREHKEKEVHDFGLNTRKKIGKRVLPDVEISRSIIDKYKK